MIFGGTLGHALCTGLAVVGGRFIAQMISVRTGTHSLRSQHIFRGFAKIKNPKQTG